MNLPELYRRWRKYSTPALAVLATALLVWSTIHIFDVPVSEVLTFLAVCVGGVLVIMLLALVASAIVRKLRQ